MDTGKISIIHSAIIDYLILALTAISGYLYYRFLYNGKRRKIIGRHRYNQNQPHYRYIDGIRTVFPAGTP
jgi:hypothetical protein